MASGKPEERRRRRADVVPRIEATLRIVRSMHGLYECVDAMVRLHFLLGSSERLMDLFCSTLLSRICSGDMGTPPICLLLPSASFVKLKLEKEKN